MNKYIFIFITLFILPNNVFATAYHPTCSDLSWNVGNYHVCSTEVWDDGATSYHVESSAGTGQSFYSFTSSTDYYITWTTNGGSGTGNIYLSNGGSSDTCVINYGIGDETCVLTSDSGSNAQSFFWEGGHGNNPSVENVCISDVSFDECTGGGGGGGGGGTTISTGSLESTSIFVGIGYILFFISLIAALWIWILLIK